MYNLSFMDDQTGFIGIVSGVNGLADGWLVGGLMLALFVITIIVFYGRVGMGELMLGSGFIYTIVSILFIKAGLLPAWSVGLSIAMLVGGLLMVFMGKN